jgi:DNA-binding LacI/PurR family transcriptional regulator
MAKKPRELRPRATSYDVAASAGVSQSAVSRAFSPDGSISEETRRRVLSAARALNYQPNALARSLITRRSNLIGLVLANATNAYYPELAMEITRQCALRGSRVLLFSFLDASELNALLDQIWTYQVDGVVACTTLSKAHERAFEEQNVPLVLYNGAPETRHVSAVSVDHVEGEGRLVRALWRAGARRFGVIAGPEGSWVARMRVDGILRQMQALDLPAPQIVRGDYTYQSGVEGLRQLLAETVDLDAIVCANDAMALGALDAARHCRPMTDEDRLSIVGFDGFGAGRWLAYDLATMRQPVERMAEAAVDILFARIEDPERPAERRTFLADFVPGASAPRAAADQDDDD